MDVAKASPLAGYFAGLVYGIQWDMVTKVCGGIYAFLLLCDWIWRKWIKPFVVKKQGDAS